MGTTAHDQTLIWSPAEMAELLEMLAQSADRLTISYSETAHICRNGAKTIRSLLTPLDESAIRADERERCARIAEAEAARWHDGSSARVAAANIRMVSRLALEQNEKEG